MIAWYRTASSGGCGQVRHGEASQRGMGAHTTRVNRFNRWQRAGHWQRILEVVSEAAYESGVQMIDS